MTKTDAAVQTLAEINPDVVLEVVIKDYHFYIFCFRTTSSYPLHMVKEPLS